MMAKKHRNHVLNSEELVVFGDTFAASRRSSLDLTNAKGDGKVGNDGALGFTAAVGDHDTPAVRLGKLSTKTVISINSGANTKVLTPGWTRKWYRFG